MPPCRRRTRGADYPSARRDGAGARCSFLRHQPGPRPLTPICSPTRRRAARPRLVKPAFVAGRVRTTVRGRAACRPACSRSTRCSSLSVSGRSPGREMARRRRLRTGVPTNCGRRSRRSEGRRNAAPRPRPQSAGRRRASDHRAGDAAHGHSGERRVLPRHGACRPRPRGPYRSRALVRDGSRLPPLAARARAQIEFRAATEGALVHASEDGLRSGVETARQAVKFALMDKSWRSSSTTRRPCPHVVEDRGPGIAAADQRRIQQFARGAPRAVRAARDRSRRRPPDCREPRRTRSRRPIGRQRCAR